MPDPIDNVEWLTVDDLHANAYNPNIVFTAELQLHERSILAIGWTQPILVTPAREIVDGYHRWCLARDSKPMRQRWGGFVPCATIDLSPAEGMMTTIRMNRAKGTHVAVRMAELVQALVDDHGLAPEEVGAGIGATRDEVDLLYQGGVFKARKLDGARYSNAWVPAESGGRGRPK